MRIKTKIRYLNKVPERLAKLGAVTLQKKPHDNLPPFEELTRDITESEGLMRDNCFWVFSFGFLGHNL